MLTFYRKEPFTLTAKYVTTDRHITDPFIGMPLAPYVPM